MKRIKLNRMLPIIALIAGLLFVWRGRHSTMQDVPPQAPIQHHPAQQQVRKVAAELRKSDAEHVSGAYIPAVGAHLTIELLRGANTSRDKSPAEGSRDWGIYLMETFGTDIATFMPANETIAISIDFYNYDVRDYQQLVLISPAEQTAQPDMYAIWLDGRPYGGTALALQRNIEDVAWEPLADTWEHTAEGYTQTDADAFDRLTFDSEAITSTTYIRTVEMQYVAGDMGGGIIFHAPNKSKKANTHAIFFANEGRYLQWGYFDDEETYQFQGGSAVSPPVNDNKWATVSVRVVEDTYEVSLNGRLLNNNIPIMTNPEDTAVYAGLFTTTSEVRFRHWEVR